MPIGRIDSVYESTISLELNINLDYRVSINSAILIDINKDQLAAFARGETKPLEMATNQVDLVYRVQLVALSEEKSTEHFHGISDLSTEKVKGTDMIRYMTGNF